MKAKQAVERGGHFFLSRDVQNPPNNGAVLTIAQIIETVMSSTAEAELGALFINAKAEVHMQWILQEMGHHQPRTPIQTDNSTAEGVINSRVQPKRTKSRANLKFIGGPVRRIWRIILRSMEFLMRVAELLRLRAQNSNKEVGLATTDRSILPQFSARVY